MSQNPSLNDAVTLLRGECVDLMRGMPENSVDSIVTDPPYGIGFMGKAWDGADIEKTMATKRRKGTVRPDGYKRHDGAAFAAGTYDRAPARMKAFQLWTEQWCREAFRVLKLGGHMLVFASPRSYHRMVCGAEDAGFEIRDQIMWVFGSGFPKSRNLDGEHKGWGTALKPAHEPIVVARKPLVGTVAKNVLTHSTGALNIDDCRVGHGAGRWPANLIHDGSDEVVAAFPTQAGAAAPVHKRNGDKFRNSFGAFAGNIDEGGSAARFFYCAKASRRDRNEGCEALPNQVAGMNSNTSSQHITRRDQDWKPEPVKNNHPTVKPTDLMRYLIRLVTPPGGVILDPFMGSGSTGKAAVLEGFRFIGCEKQADYIAISRARIDAAIRHRAHGSSREACGNKRATSSVSARPAPAEDRQATLF